MLILDLLNGRFSTKIKTEFKAEAKPDKIKNTKKKKYRTRDRKTTRKAVQCRLSLPDSPGWYKFKSIL